MAGSPPFAPQLTPAPGPRLELLTTALYRGEHAISKSQGMGFPRGSSRSGADRTPRRVHYLNSAHYVLEVTNRPGRHSREAGRWGGTPTVHLTYPEAPSAPTFGMQIPVQ